MNGLELGRSQPDRQPLVVNDRVVEPELLEQPQNTLRARIIEMVNGDHTGASLRTKQRRPQSRRPPSHAAKSAHCTADQSMQHGPGSAPARSSLESRSMEPDERLPPRVDIERVARLGGAWLADQ